MSDYTFQQTFFMSQNAMRDMLYSGRVSEDIYEAHSLYGELIMFARFDRPMSGYWCDEPMRIVYTALLIRLIAMRILPFVLPYPMPAKTRWHSDLNRHIEVGRYRVF